MTSTFLDFSKYENKYSKFHADIGLRGGFITFSNSGQRGEKKYFTLSLDSFLSILKDIKTNLLNFKAHEDYVEGDWRDLGSSYFSDEVAKAMSTVQTKPLFSTLSKIIMWANFLDLTNINPEQKIDLSEAKLNVAIEKLNELAERYRYVPPEGQNPSQAVITNAIGFTYKLFHQKAKESNLQFSESIIARFTASLITKPFVILMGLSGSGKTKLAQAFSSWICENESQYCIVPVGADWTNREPLLGFPDALDSKNYVMPQNGALKLIIESQQAGNENKPYFLILDEMNLSHVERYFADFLSAMESKSEIELYSGPAIGKVPDKIKLPSNLFIIGTVNIDETTYMFSPKVLDRASVIEFRLLEEEMSAYLKVTGEVDMEAMKKQGIDMASSFVTMANDKTIALSDTAGALNESLMAFFTELKKTGAEFGYRSASEILRFVAVTQQLDASWNIEKITDAAIMQKLLPKVHGSRKKLAPVLIQLGTLCLNKEQNIKDVFDKKEAEHIEKAKFPVSLEKIVRMYHNLMDNGFTSYAEA